MNPLFYIFNMIATNHIELHDILIDPSIFTNSITVIRFDIYDGIQKIELDCKSYNENSLKITDILSYSSYQRFYIKNDNTIKCTGLLYNNKLVTEFNKDILRLLVKIRFMVTESREKIEEYDIITNRDLQIYLIYDFSESFKFTGKDKLTYIKHLKKALWYLYRVGIDYSTDFKPSIVSDVCSYFDLSNLNEADFLNCSKNLSYIFSLCNEQYPDELILSDEQVKTLDLLIN